LISYSILITCFHLVSVVNPGLFDADGVTGGKMLFCKLDYYVHYSLAVLLYANIAIAETIVVKPT